MLKKNGPRQGLGWLVFQLCLFILLCSACVVVAQVPDPTPKLAGPDDQYFPGPDSKPQPGVPEGQVIEFSMPQPGAPKGRLQKDGDPKTAKELLDRHVWWLYIPPGYDKRRPLPIMVFMDGVQFGSHWGYRIPIVLNNLIAKKEIPMMAALFVDTIHGISHSSDGAPVRRIENRHVAWDRDYPNFLVKEIFPTIRKYVTITDDPNGRAIVGGSATGSIAFEVAFTRPDLFRKMVSFVGTFGALRTNMVPGKQSSKPSDLVRQSERKPIRLFLQEGSNDGSYEATKEFAAALTEKGYDLKLVIGEGTHNGKHGISIFPDIVRWLWRDYPK